jgi:GNAT superfamily N-acetyltransferase
LVFPPVWTPVTPYLALPSLSAYLRAKGLSIRQYDASLDFFLDHLLAEPTLETLLEKACRVVKATGQQGGGEIRSTDEDLLNNKAMWRDKIRSAGRFISTLRSKEAFYDPASCIAAQDGIYSLLRMASAAFHPVSFTFNTFSNPAVKDFRELLRHCRDPESNPFISFYMVRIPALIDGLRPGLIGISITTGNQMIGGLTLALFLRENYPSIHVTLGGRHMLRLGESLRENPPYFSRLCNSMVNGDGERPLECLISALSSEGDLRSVPGLVLCDAGRVVECGPEEQVPISELPAPDFSDLPLSKYLSPTPIVPFRLSEGCYWGKCTFCSRYDTRRFSTIGPAEAAARIEEVHRRFSVSCFAINDDCLTPPYLEAFCRELAAKDLGLSISLWCKPVAQFSPARIELMARAGVRLIRWGVETGHPRILKLMNKGTDLADTLRVLSDSSSMGIWNHATMILGFPTETLEEAKETIGFLEGNLDAIHSSILFRFSLLTHSYIMRRPDLFSIKQVEAPNSPFSYEHPFSCASGMKPEQLREFLRWANRYRVERIYGHPLWYYLRNREYLLLYVAAFGLERVRAWKVSKNDRSIYTAGDRTEYFVKTPEEIAPDVMEMICGLIEAGGEVGRSWIRENLKAAFLIGYAMEEGRVVGTLTHKRPKEKYLAYLKEKTGIELTGYLERGYTYLRPEYRGRGIADRILKALVERSRGMKIYVTIRTDNKKAVALSLRNGMRLVASYHNDRTGHEIGLFTNTPPTP